eukprot:SAG11_NODE_19753_length_459_cov_1.569444_1_plen_147_part_01
MTRFLSDWLLGMLGFRTLLLGVLGYGNHTVDRSLPYCSVDAEALAYRTTYCCGYHVQMRKLLLVGLLSVVERGSVLQVCVGMWTCLAFLSAQLHSKPFRFNEDNVLKTCAEAHLFLMLMSCLVLKTDLEGEYLREHGYDLILTASFI